MDPGRRKLVVAAVCASSVVAGAVAGLAAPSHMLGAAVWSTVVVAVLFGLGGVLRRALTVELAVGEQLLVGTAVWIATSGLLLAAGIASRIPLAVLAAGGIAAAAVELLAWLRRPDARPQRVADEPRGAYVMFHTLLAVVLLLNLLGMLGTRGNPADDHAAYTAFVKRVLDCGDLTEPFSFRRLSAYGGQTMLHALTALRGEVITLDLLDRGIFQWIAVLLTLDVARRRGLHLVLQVIVVALVLSLWDLQLNSGPIWTAYTCFLGAYAFASREDIPVRARLVLALAALGTACTLRQNYLVPAGLFGILLVVTHFTAAVRERGARPAWHAERNTIGLAVGAAALVVVPYMLAAVRDVGTALYPILLGTGNPDAPLRPAGSTALDEISFFVSILFTTEPIRVWWLLLPIMLVVRDHRALRPWRSFAVACAIGFAVLVHSFMLSDAWNLWRYGFGYLTPLAVVLAIEAAARLEVLGGDSRREGDGKLAMPAAAGVLVWLALVFNMIATREDVARRYNYTLQNLAAAWRLGPGNYEPRVRSYGELQASIPAGETIAVLLDDPWKLDYARNRIVNLDIPGFAAPAPGLPSFTTPEHWRAYLRGQGIRYVAFVDPTQSSYLYRRQQWLFRIFREDELYQYIAAHMVDAQDALLALARTSGRLYERDGLVAIDLGAETPEEPPRGPAERTRMDTFIRQLSERELHSNAWQLAHRSTVVFKKDGLGPSDVVVPQLQQAPNWLARFASLPEPPYRWLSARTRIRVHGDGAHTLRLKMWVNPLRAHARLTLTVSVDGEIVTEAQPDQAHEVNIETPVTCDGWCDVYLVFNSTFEWWLDATDNEVAKLLELDWTAR